MVHPLSWLTIFSNLLFHEYNITIDISLFQIVQLFTVNVLHVVEKELRIVFGAGLTPPKQQLISVLVSMHIIFKSSTSPNFKQNESLYLIKLIENSCHFTGPSKHTLHIDKHHSVISVQGLFYYILKEKRNGTSMNRIENTHTHTPTHTHTHTHTPPHTHTHVWHVGCTLQLCPRYLVQGRFSLHSLSLSLLFLNGLKYPDFIDSIRFT